MALRFIRSSLVRVSVSGLTLSVALASPAAAQDKSQTVQIWCYSELSAPEVYFTEVFAVTFPFYDRLESSALANEYFEYLKGRYDYTSRVSLPTGCPHAQAVPQALSTRADMAATITKEGRRVIELQWKYALPPLSNPADGARANLGPADHGFCFSPGASGTMYVAGPFRTKSPMSLFEGDRDFSRFLAQKYGFKGGGSCNIGNATVADRWVKLHVQGARDGNRKVVETGWEPGMAQSSAAVPKPVDNDPEPPRPAPPPAPPSAQAREFATKEMPDVTAKCNSDRVLSGAFDCGMVARTVYNYRLATWGKGATPEPLDQLWSGDTLDCSQCVRPFAAAWAASRAQSQGLPQAPAQCVGERFVAAIRAKPYINRINEAFDAALAACKK
jgi:hypothetical protein